MVVWLPPSSADKSRAAAATMLTASMDTNDFFHARAHPKLRLVESPTAGVFLSGMCQGRRISRRRSHRRPPLQRKVIGLLCKDSLTYNRAWQAQPDEMILPNGQLRKRSARMARSTYIDKELEFGTGMIACVARRARVNPAVCQVAARAPLSAYVRRAMDSRASPTGKSREVDDMQVNGSDSHDRGVLLQLCPYGRAGSFRHEPALLTRQCEHHPRIPCSCRLKLRMFILRKRSSAG